MKRKTKRVKPSDYLELLKEYGFVPSKKNWTITQLKLKDINFEKAPELKKYLMV